MVAPTVQESLILLQMVCVIIVAAYLVIRSSFFLRCLDGKHSLLDCLVLSVFFGIVSIYGSVSGVEIYGAIINVRDLGPLVGGLVCGPAVGIGAGLIGASFRMTLGGFTAVPCSLATVAIGLFGGLIYVIRKGAFPPIRMAVAIAAAFELFHMAMVLAICRPFSQAMAVVEASIIPMVISNATGMLVFSYIITNLIVERRTKEEHDRYQSELERKKAELKIAFDIQRSFLPHHTPEISGFDLAASTTPAMEVGGDFYDFISLPGSKLALVVADVAGKSVPAALFMALSRTILRASASHHPNSKDVLDDANRMISEDAAVGMFVTLFYGVLDGGSGILDYANAGHPPPLLWRAEEGHFASLGVTGIALGAMYGVDYNQSQARISPGDILVIYTDGVTEAINEKDEQYGVQRLQEVVVRSRNVPASQIIKNLLEDIAMFSGNYEQYDDITVMVIKSKT